MIATLGQWLPQAGTPTPQLFQAPAVRPVGLWWGEVGACPALEFPALTEKSQKSTLGLVCPPPLPVSSHVHTPPPEETEAQRDLSYPDGTPFHALSRSKGQEEQEGVNFRTGGAPPSLG